MGQKNIMWFALAGVGVLALIGGYVLLRPSEQPSASPGYSPSSPYSVSPTVPSAVGPAVTPPSTLPEKTETHSITYRNGVFSPSAITIKAGETVVFQNEDSSSLWVASDPHPIHTDLLGFDARRGMNQGETYSFTFIQKGAFGYHNHLSPGARGTIVVE